MLLPLLLLALGGCQSAQIDWSSWASRHGGLIQDDRQARATTLADHLADCLIDQPIHIHVLDTADLSAYSFSSGDILVSRGLVDQTTDDELAAAIAHELGHLFQDGRFHAVVALAGKGNAHDVEARADAIGCQLLAARGASAAAMISLLRKLVSASPCGPDSAALQKRISLLAASSRSLQSSN